MQVLTVPHASTQSTHASTQSTPCEYSEYPMWVRTHTPQLLVRGPQLIDLRHGRAQALGCAHAYALWTRCQQGASLAFHSLALPCLALPCRALPSLSATPAAYRADRRTHAAASLAPQRVPERKRSALCRRPLFYLQQPVRRMMRAKCSDVAGSCADVARSCADVAPTKSAWARASRKQNESARHGNAGGRERRPSPCRPAASERRPPLRLQHSNE